MILTEKILNEGTITAEAFAIYLYNKCLKDKVKQHTDKLYSIPETILRAWVISQNSDNRSFIPAKINRIGGKTTESPAYTKFVYDVLSFFKNKKIDVDETAIKNAIDSYGKLVYGPAARGVGYASVITEGYFNY